MNKLLLFFIFVIAIFTAAARLSPHVPNFTPVGAFALFAGAYLAPKTKWAFILPFFLMFFSDLFIGFYDWKLMAVVYGSFAFYTFLGILVFRKKNPLTLITGALGGAVFFFLATNFAVWAFSPWYEKTFAGLLFSYEMALPFFRSMLFGDIVFTALFFGAYETLCFLAFSKQKKLLLARASETA